MKCKCFLSQDIPTTTTTPPAPTPVPTDICHREGFNADPHGDCTVFYECHQVIQGKWPFWLKFSIFQYHDIYALLGHTHQVVAAKLASQPWNPSNLTPNTQNYIFFLWWNPFSMSQLLPNSPGVKQVTLVGKG